MKYCFAFCLAFLCAIAAAESPTRVIWLSIDSLRADSLGCGGYDPHISPNIDAIANAGLRFGRAIAPSHVTRRSVASTFTSQHFSRITNDPTSWMLPKEALTLAEVLQQAGVKTYMWSANPLLTGSVGYFQGFDHAEYVHRYSRVSPTIEDLTAVIGTEYKPSGEPEFLYIHTMDVHTPYRPPLEFERRYVTPGYSRGVVKEGSAVDVTGKILGSAQQYFRDRHDATMEDIRLLRELYDGTIAWTDTRLPDLLAALRFDPATDLLIISSDHGEQFMEGGYWGHGYNLLPPEIHVPLILQWDGLKKGVVDAPVSLMDLFPTLCELFGAPIPENISGVSLLPALKGKEPPSHLVYAERIDTCGPGAAIVTPTHIYELTTSQEYLRPWVLWPFHERLFDLRDPANPERDVRGDAAPIANELNEKLRALNPRWTAFTPEVIRPQGAVVINPHSAFTFDLAAAPAFQGQGAQYHVELPGTILKAEAKGVDVSRIWALQCEYRLLSGHFLLVVTDAETGKVLRDYHLRRPRENWTPYTANVSPRSGAVKFELRALQPGHLEIRKLGLYPTNAPLIWPAPVGPDTAVGETPDSYTDAVQEQLRSLGYL